MSRPADGHATQDQPNIAKATRMLLASMIPPKRIDPSSREGRLWAERAWKRNVHSNHERGLG